VRDNQTKQRIIDTAYALFEEQSYDKITVSDICAACNITKTTFYYHLNSKEEIINVYYRSVIARQADRLIDVLSAENHWEQLMICFEQLMESSDEIGPGIFGRILVMNLKTDIHSLDFDNNLTKMAVILIAKGQKSGQIRNNSEPLHLYRAACHAFEGYELMWCVKKGGFDRKQAVRFAMEQIFDVSPELRSNSYAEYTY
jgi:AcrR family transcriptional regulator